MFTGLIQGMGKVLGVDTRGQETRFSLQPLFELADIQLGESIAVNGVCLTVEKFSTGVFQAYASQETLRASSLGDLRMGHTVNLERALALGDRLGGHLVSGHVDCLATVASISPSGESRVYRLAFPAEYGPFVVPKGSVALDGISLTVNNCGADFLEVNIIPSTQRETTIASWNPGRKVNMETDLIGKYVQQMLAPWTGAGSAAPLPEGTDSGLTEEFFRKYGF